MCLQAPTPGPARTADSPLLEAGSGRPSSHGASSGGLGSRSSNMELDSPAASARAGEETVPASPEHEPSPLHSPDAQQALTRSPSPPAFPAAALSASLPRAAAADTTAPSALAAELRLQLSPSDSLQRRPASRAASSSGEASQLYISPPAAAAQAAAWPAQEAAQADATSDSVALAEQAPAAPAAVVPESQPPQADDYNGDVEPLDLYMDLSSSESSPCGSPHAAAGGVGGGGGGGGGGCSQEGKPAGGRLAPRLSLQLSDASDDDEPASAAAASAADAGTAAAAGGGQAAAAPEAAEELLLPRPLTLRLSSSNDMTSQQQQQQQEQQGGERQLEQQTTMHARQQASSMPAQPAKGMPEPPGSPMHASPAPSPPGSPMQVDRPPGRLVIAFQDGSEAPSPALLLAAAPVALPSPWPQPQPAASDTGSVLQSQQPAPQSQQRASQQLQPSEHAAGQHMSPASQQAPVGNPQQAPAASTQQPSPATPAAAPQLQASSAGGLTRTSGGGVRRNSPGTRASDGSGLQLAQGMPQRTPQRTPSHGVRFVGQPLDATAATPYRQPGGSTSSGGLLRLSPLGSDLRLGNGSQPRTPAEDGLAAERAAGLRIFRPLDPPPTQVRCSLIYALFPEAGHVHQIWFEGVPWTCHQWHSTEGNCTICCACKSMRSREQAHFGTLVPVHRRSWSCRRASTAACA